MTDSGRVTDVDPLAAVPGPWFRGHPRAAVVLATLLFVAIFGIRFAVGGTSDMLSGLFVLPVALLAMAFGTGAGLGAGLAAVGFVAVWIGGRGLTLSPLGWVSRAVPLLLLGWLVGRASDQLRDAALRQRRLEAAALLHREAAEVNDSLVQGMAVAKWLFEADERDRGLAALTETMETAQDLVARQLRQSARPLVSSRGHARNYSPLDEGAGGRWHDGHQ